MRLRPARVQPLNQQTREQITRGLPSHHGKGQSPRRGLSHGDRGWLGQRTIPRCGEEACKKPSIMSTSAWASG
jgi:hypothetical protein